MRRIYFFTSLFLMVSMHAHADCFETLFKDINMTVCPLDEKQHIPVMIHKDSNDKPFKNVNNAIKTNNNTFAFLMNAGMYHHDLSPVGLYIEKGEVRQKISTNEGPGNFHLMPNGVFYIIKWNDNFAYHIKTTDAYLKAAPKAYYATQSGPMLVIENQLHPRFIKESDSKYIRNGVGITAQGQVYFVISQSPINFYDFATFFRDELKTPNALYFDGKISTAYAPPFKTQSTWFSVGPMVGAIFKKK